jgi:DNA-binding NarL/FixJ family response regulator
VSRPALPPWLPGRDVDGMMNERSRSVVPSIGGSWGERTGEKRVRWASPRGPRFPARMPASAGRRGRPASTTIAMEARRPVHLAVAQFEDLIARGLRALVAEDPNIELVADDVGYEQLERVIAGASPDVALVNFGSLQTPSDVRTLAGLHAETRLVVLANRPSPAECNQMLAFGATACLSKETQARDILNAIHLASRGLHVLPKTAKEFGMRRMPGPELLTPREADVLELLQQGRSNAEIAAALQVGVETIRTHARSIYRKLGVRTRRELANLSAY